MGNGGGWRMADIIRPEFNRFLRLTAAAELINGHPAGNQTLQEENWNAEVEAVTYGFRNSGIQRYLRLLRRFQWMDGSMAFADDFRSDGQ